MELNKINEKEYELIRKVRLHSDSVKQYKNRIKDGIFIGYQDREYKENPKMLSKLSQEIKGIDRCIIHLIPQEDTLDNEYEINLGISECLFFKAIIYNPSTMEYCVKNNVDSIHSNIPYTTRIFKDMSTMLLIDQPCTIFGSICLFINKYDKGAN